jgi:hypothetical protein
MEGGSQREGEKERGRDVMTAGAARRGAGGRLTRPASSSWTRASTKAVVSGMSACLMYRNQIAESGCRVEPASRVSDAR